MIKKSFVKAKKEYKVTFELPTDQVGKDRDVRVLGTFNGWSWDKGLSMSNGKSSYKADINLAPGEYQFRYLIDNQEWKNDMDAPGYTASGYASDNCVLTLDKVAEAKKAAPAKKAAAKPAAKKAAPAKKVAAKPAAKKAAPAKKAAAKADDLKRIEGVGPKIAGLLNDAGIHTFAELGEASPKKLADVLSAAGARFRLAKPDTWQQQAKLAAAGKTDALKKLQDELKGGVKK
jgi:predicted flap endonuclease-1-like 5' DNA nuclease